MYQNVKFVFFVFVVTLGIPLSIWAQLPDFGKAVKWSNVRKDVPDGANECSGRVFKLENSCKVGKYNVEIYYESEDGTLYKYVSLVVDCFKNFNLNHPVLSSAEIEEHSSEVPAMGYGHWWIRADIGCGRLYEFEVYKTWMVRRVHLLGCE